MQSAYRTFGTRGALELSCFVYHFTLLRAASRYVFGEDPTVCHFHCFSFFVWSQWFVAAEAAAEASCTAREFLGRPSPQGGTAHGRAAFDHCHAQSRTPERRRRFAFERRKSLIQGGTSYSDNKRCYSLLLQQTINLIRSFEMNQCYFILKC